jgi:hypothetical protein
MLYFVDRASRHKFLLITNLMHFFMYLFIYFISLHVSNITMLIIRRLNCINAGNEGTAFPSLPAYQAVTYTD